MGLNRTTPGAVFPDSASWEQIEISGMIVRIVWFSSTLFMLKNYFKIAVRNLTRSASYTLINVSGLALGITCALLIFSLVSYHLSFDDFHRDSNRTYRFVTEQHRDQLSYVASVPPAFGKTFRNDYSYAEKVAHLFTGRDVLVSFYEGNNLRKFTETIAFADPEFFSIFNFPLVAGDRSKFLVEPNTAIVTERIARKYFGDESPLDKTLKLENRLEFRITGVLKDIPDNTDFRAEIYFSYSTIGQYNEWYAAEDSWGGITSSIETFTRLQEGTAPADVESSLTAYVKKYRPDNKNVHHYKLQPLSDIHFNENYGGVIRKEMLVVLSVIGFFLIFTACLNFINLATAQAVTRSKEVGVRKTLGSMRSQLFWQFAAETGAIVVLSTIVGLAVAYSILPFVNQLFGTRVRFELLSDIRLLLFIPALMLVVTFLSCSYPGLILSGFKPVIALKGKLQGSGTGNFNLRRTLITLQFTISQVMLIGLIVVVYQMKYFTDTDMGFDREAIVMIPAGSNDQKMNALKEKFASIPNVENVTACFTTPSSDNRWGTSLFFDKRTEAEVFSISFRGGDENFISTFGIDLIAGRNLTPSDTVREFLVNETLVKKLNLSSPEEILGRHFRVNGDWNGHVVGVVRDFHDLSLRADISPVFITTSRENFYSFGVKINMKNSRETLAALEKAWLEMYPEQLYTYDFVDNLTAEFYQAEETMLTLIQAFSFIALFIGCMGLYGLVSFMSLQKTKEIGIRKVLGGSVAHILWIFGREFTRLILIAFLLAAPLGWFLMSQWLQGYAYHVEMTPWMLVFEVVIIGFIVLATVGFKAGRSALMNPVRALRTE